MFAYSYLGQWYLWSLYYVAIINALTTNSAANIRHIGIKAVIFNVILNKVGKWSLMLNRDIVKNRVRFLGKYIAVFFKLPIYCFQYYFHLLSCYGYEFLVFYAFGCLCSFISLCFIMSYSFIRIMSVVCSRDPPTP